MSKTRARCISVIGLLGLVSFIFGTTASARPLTIDEILATTTVDRADISPNTAEIAISVARRAAPGEVFGRNAYEIDPSRNDIWLVTRDGAQLSQLTDGKDTAAGYWCPYWSPDGQRLAMLSTAPERAEPRGGDNARIYVWERDSDSLRRVSDRAVMTQVRYGSPLNELDLRPAGARSPNSCRDNDENAPFLWLDADRLLVVLMPSGERSAMVDRFAKFHREAAQAGADVRAGNLPTVSRSSSAIAGADLEERIYTAELVIFDLANGSTTSLGKVDAFPMFGALTLALSPDSRRAAILAPVRAIAPKHRGPDMPNVQAWAVENELFMLDFGDQPSLQRVAVPAESRYPLDIIGWSLQGEHVAVRARADPGETSARLWSLNARSGEMTALAPDKQFGSQIPAHWREADYAIWFDRHHLLVKGNQTTDDWQVVGVQSGQATAIQSKVEGLSDFHLFRNRLLVGRSKEEPVRYDSSSRRFVAWESGMETGCAGDDRLVAERQAVATRYSLWAGSGPGAATITLTGSSRLLGHDCTGMVWVENGFEGSAIYFAGWNDPVAPRLLMKRNEHLAQIDWGERRMIDYAHADGSPLQMAVLLPSDFDPTVHYPTLLWVYGGYQPSGVDDFFLDPHMPGFYNLQLYASRSYVVAIPSIPIKRGDKPSEPFAAIPGGVMPALDKLMELGITDAARVGILGQSFGGYTVNALVAQTDRFAAAASIAGASELATSRAAFDPAARGWPGVAQDMAANVAIYEAGLGFKVDPAADPELYHRNSPLTYVDRIETPLLIIHGELDTRAPLSQPEALYSLLRRRGRPAKLLRYWGESHSLANSPANIRDISDELINWFDRYLKRGDERGL